MVGHFICIFHFTEKQTRVSAGAVPRRTRSPRVQQRAGAGSRAAAPGGQAEALPLFPHRPGRELRGRPHATDTRGTGGPGRQSAPSPGPGAGSGPPRAAAGEGRDRQHARGCPAAGSTVAPDVAAALTAAPLTATAPTAAAPTAAPRLPLPPPWARTPSSSSLPPGPPSVRGGAAGFLPGLGRAAGAPPPLPGVPRAGAELSPSVSAQAPSTAACRRCRHTSWGRPPSGRCCGGPGCAPRRCRRWSWARSSPQVRRCLPTATSPSGPIGTAQVSRFRALFLAVGNVVPWQRLEGHPGRCSVLIAGVLEKMCWGESLFNGFLFVYLVGWLVSISKLANSVLVKVSFFSLLQHPFSPCLCRLS